MGLCCCCKLAGGTRSVCTLRVSVCPLKLYHWPARVWEARPLFAGLQDSIQGLFSSHSKPWSSRVLGADWKGATVEVRIQEPSLLVERIRGSQCVELAWRSLGSGL